MASDADTPATSSMEESGSKCYPMPRKGLHMQAILKESVTEGELEQPESCIFFTELRALTQFIDEVSALRKCSTEGCLGRLVPVAVNRVVGAHLSLDFTSQEFERSQTFRRLYSRHHQWQYKTEEMLI